MCLSSLILICHWTFSDYKDVLKSRFQLILEFFNCISGLIFWSWRNLSSSIIFASDPVSGSITVGMSFIFTVHDLLIFFACDFVHRIRRCWLKSLPLELSLEQLFFGCFDIWLSFFSICQLLTILVLIILTSLIWLTTSEFFIVSVLLVLFRHGDYVVSHCFNKMVAYSIVFIRVVTFLCYFSYSRIVRHHRFIVLLYQISKFESSVIFVLLWKEMLVKFHDELGPVWNHLL